MKTIKRKAPSLWDLPDWQVDVLLMALTDHELVLRLRDRSGYAYRVMLDQIRANLHAKLSGKAPR